MEKNSFKGPEVDPENVELVPGFFRGYRTWIVTFEGYLKPTGFDQPMLWKPGRNEAECFRTRLPFYDEADEKSVCDQSPGITCGDGNSTHGCGFYGTYDTMNRAARDYLWHNRQEGWSTTRFAIGSIKATGRIILGQYGFRAQYAEIESIVLYQPNPERVFYPEVLAKHYPNTAIYHSLDHLLHDFPPISVEELVGPYPEEDELQEIINRWVVKSTPPINLAQVAQNFTWATYRPNPFPITGMISPPNFTVTRGGVLRFPSVLSPPTPRRPWIKGKSKRRKKIEEE